MQKHNYSDSHSTNSWRQGNHSKLIPLLFLCMLTLAASAFAVHDTEVTITPDKTNCNELGKTFAVHVENLVSSADSIYEVRIYESAVGIVEEDFECGPAPPNWTLHDFTALYDYCEYKTTKGGAYMIDPNETRDFTFKAVMKSDACSSEFLISTLDDGTPIGEHEYKYPKVLIDCTNPIVNKTVGTPKIAGTGFDWWITQSTNININASDADGTCDLGLDYCRYKYTVDGGADPDFETECVAFGGTYSDPWCVFKNGPTEIFNFQFNEDSVHDIRIECYDVVGNMAYINEVDKVDDTPPETDKVYGTPSYPAGINTDAPYPHWITTNTLITLTEEDGGNICAIGTEKTWYIDFVVENALCEAEQNCQEICTNPYDKETMYMMIEKAQLVCEDWQGMKYDSWGKCVEEEVARRDVYCITPDKQKLRWKLYQNTGPFTKDAESCHIIQFFSVDELLNVEEMNTQCVYVEDTAPTLWKEHDQGMIEDKDGELDLFHWMTKDMAIDLYCKDQGDHPVDNVVIWHSIWDDISGTWTAWESTSGPGTVHKEITFGEDSVHKLRYYCVDALGNSDGTEAIPYEQAYRVDTAPPKINKSIREGDPQYGDCPPKEGETCWIQDHDTHILIDAVDEGICAIDDVQCEWSYYLDGQYYGSGFPCNGPTCDITFPQETEHELHVTCWDKLGNTAEDVETFYVDSSGPEVSKQFDGPQKIEGQKEWIDGVTTISLTSKDNPADKVCAVGEDKIYYRITPEENDVCNEPAGCTVVSEPDLQDGSWMEYNPQSPIGGIPESCHKIEFVAVDKLGNVGDVKANCFFVDHTAPLVHKDNGQAIPGTGEEEFETGDNPNGEFHWISQSMPVTLWCEDQQPHPSGGEKVCYKVSYDYPDWDYITESYCSGDLTQDGYCCLTGTAQTPFEFYFQEDSMHNLEYYCQDAVEKKSAVHVQYYKVDDTPPSTTKTYDPEPYIDPETHYEYIDTVNKILLEAEDGGETCAIDGITTYYRTKLVNDEMCTTSCVGSSHCDAPPAEETFYLTGNVAGTVTKTDNGDSYTWTINITSDNPAHHVWGVGMAFATSTNQPAFQVWHTGATGDPSNIWQYQDYGTGWNGTVEPLPTQGITATGDQTGQVFTITVPKTKLGNDGCSTFYWAVQARTNLIGKYPSTWAQWSGGPGEVSGMQSSVLGGNVGWNEYTDEFGIPEESCHLIEFYSEDALGNQEDIKYQCVFVDKKGPEITKTYGEPFFSEDGKEWINSQTPIYISIIDPAPHPSGVKESRYRITQMAGNEPCESTSACQEASGSGEDNWVTFTDSAQTSIGQESCHLIEIESVDNVGKASEHKQCVYVDNTAPTPVKTVGEPKDKWTPGENGDPISYFYPEETANCWLEQGGIDCWEVTTLTPITMDCQDLGPHPVDHETVCFNVELDGEDKTRKYCHQYGNYDSETGYCCTHDEVPTFYFKEDSEHNLKYYCVDALGNSNEDDLDEEKFKVDGTKFEIPLFKKWNLISVPFQLLSDSPDDVFTEDKGVTGVNSVWTYDPTGGCDVPETEEEEEWCVFTPDGKPNDNLDSIRPGWGYWVMETLNEPKDCSHGCFGNEPSEWLTLGGSLFETGPVGPPSKQLVKGWNLIGYYGSNWEQYEWSDFDFLCEDIFHPKDKYLFGDQVYCALNSLVDTQEGYPRWSGLWSYLNCGNHCEDWVGLNACSQQSKFKAQDRMYAGRGYWIEMDVPDLYAPATNCIWNSGFECSLTGGGFFGGGII